VTLIATAPTGSDAWAAPTEGIDVDMLIADRIGRRHDSAGEPNPVRSQPC
jgi:hypothetical protein